MQRQGIAMNRFLDRLTDQLRHYPAEIHLNSSKLQIHIPATAAKPSQAVIADITQILRIWELELQQQQIQQIVLYGLRGDRAIVWRQTIDLSAKPTSPNDPYSFTNPHLNLFAFPSFLILGTLANFLVKPLLFGWHTWTHEVGHAIVAWFSGHQATPLPFGWTNVNPERSFFVYCCFLTLLGIIGWMGWKENKRAVVGVTGVLAFVQFCMTWLMNRDMFEMLLAFGGLGGELYISAALIVTFYFPLPDRWRWDFWRYPIGILAASTFTDNFARWHSIKRGTQDIPWGSLFGGEDDAGGDMNRLSGDYGWSDHQIIQTYSVVGITCLVAMLAIYGVMLLRQFNHQSLEK
jgi:hypothetical protein